jgi:outer membrane protein OmpA-like peptidoglycan-associated protein/tetratricopeptide (TPR) repeat protein/mRNA-degrading endonuclease HigB of HigAB toxin-antitoxin module
MKLKTFLLLIILIGNLGVIAFAKGPSFTMRRANKLFNSFAYKDAAALYEMELKKNPKNILAQKNAATSYRKMNDMLNAEKWYAKVVENESTDPENYLFYAQTLEFNGKMDEAKVYYKKFTASANMDKRGERKMKSIDAMSSFYTDSIYYKINRVSFNTSGSDYGVAFCKEGLTFATGGIQNSFVKSEFKWSNEAFSDLFLVRMFDDRDSVFAPAKALSDYVNSKYNEGPACYDSEGRTLAFTRNGYFKGKAIAGKDKTNHLQIYIATDKMHDWKNIKSFNQNSTNYSVCHPAFSMDSKTMYFVSDMPGGFGGTDIYMSKNDNGKWTDPINMGTSINTEGNELFPSVLRDSILYFASNGKGGLGGLDIFAAQIKGEKVQEVTNMGYPINTVYDDFGLIYNKSKKIGFFSSNRPGGKGKDDIYRFTYSKPDFQLKLLVLDSETKQPLKNATVKLFDSKSKLLQEVKTNEAGAFVTPIEMDAKYTVSVNNTKYFDQAMPFDTKGVKGFEKLVEVPMFKDLGFNLVGKITDSESKSSMEGVQITIVDAKSGADIYTGNTNAEGDFQKNLSNYSLNQMVNYEIKLEKPGYIAKTIYYSKQLSKSGDVKLNDDINLGMEKLKVGTDIGKVFNLNPIYFDIGKFDIREDAELELNKIVKALEDNPTIVIEIGSHTDSRSAAKANLTLSDKRAKASVEYIISKGIEKTRVNGKGYGESKLVNKCKDGVKCSEEDHQQNRRTEFRIVKT